MRIVQAVMTNRDVKVTRPYPTEIKDMCSFHPPGFWFMPSYKMGIWDGLVRKMRYDKIPTGLFLVLRKQMEEELEIEFQIEDKTTPIQFRPIEASNRDYQTECVEMLQLYAQSGGGLIIAATGVGKTRMAGNLFKSLIGNGCFVVDELTLLEQSRKAIEAVIEERVGVVGRSEFTPERISVATAQTLYLHRDRKPFKEWSSKLTVLMIDEIHQQISKRTWTYLESIKPPVVYGLTATLELQKKHIQFAAYSLAGPVAYSFPLEEATAAGYLTRGIVVQILLRTQGGPFMGVYTDDYRALVHSPRRNSLIADLAVTAIGKDRRVVILVEWVEHLKILSKVLGTAVSFHVVYGGKSVEQRQQAIKEFEAGTVNLILANRVFSKGIDIPRCDFIIDATAGKSANSAIQRYGRGVRLAEGKKSLIYIDIADYGNRFELTARARKRAFRKQKIDVYPVGYRATLNLGKLLERAIELSEKGTNEKETKQRSLPFA